MLDEKKKMELNKIKTLAYLINGGTLEDEDDDESVVYYDPLM
jgi:hypothetical protein